MTDIKEIKVNNKDRETADFEHRRKNFIKAVEKDALQYQVDLVAVIKYGNQGLHAEMVVVDIKKGGMKKN